MRITDLRKTCGLGATAAALLLSAGLGSASASPITFNFNSLSAGASDASVQSYMNGMLTGVGSVVVTGAQADTTYTGDGHVVGTVSGSTVTPITLGPDAFIDTYASTEIDMTFKNTSNQPLKIYSVTFDYEIFPNGSCTDLNKFIIWYSDCGGGTTPDLPDFTFKADGTTYLYSQAVSPGNAADPYTHSTDSGKNGTELAPQLGPQTVTFTFANGVSTLDFLDWPATIGIDNLIIDTTPPNQQQSTVPEPGSMVLLGTGIAGLVARYRRKAAR